MVVWTILVQYTFRQYRGHSLNLVHSVEHYFCLHGFWRHFRDFFGISGPKDLCKAQTQNVYKLHCQGGTSAERNCPETFLLPEQNTLLQNGEAKGDRQKVTKQKKVNKWQNGCQNVTETEKSDPSSFLPPSLCSTLTKASAKYAKNAMRYPWICWRIVQLFKHLSPALSSTNQQFVFATRVCRHARANALSRAPHNQSASVYCQMHLKCQFSSLNFVKDFGIS